MTTRFVAFDLRSGVQLGEVPLGQVSWTERLNADCELSGRVDLAQRKVDGSSLGAFYRELLTPGRVKLAVIPDEGDPVSFIIWERSYDGDRFLSIRCTGIWSYTARYQLTERKSYADNEQFDIARDLIYWVRTQQASNTGLLIDTTNNSGVRRTAVYDGFEYRPIGDIVTELADSDDGFEFSIESAGGIRGVTDVWTAHYPYQGTLYADTPKTIALGRVPVAFQLSEREPITTLTLLGAGEGDAMVTASMTANSVLSDGYPALPVSVAFKNEASATVLGQRVGGELLKMIRQRKTWTLTGRRDTDRYDWSEIGIGDEVTIELPAGTDRLYPEGLTLLQRVVSRTIALDDNGAETITLEFGDTASTLPTPAAGVATYRVVGTGDSILAMSWGFGGPGGVILTADRWLDFEHGRGPYTTGLAFRYSTAGIWPLLESASEPEGWVIVQDNSLGTTDALWEALMRNIRDELPDNRNLVAVLPGYLASVNAATSATVATRAAIMQTVLAGHPRANFVDLAAYMGSNPSQFPDGQHPNATAQAWIKAAITALTG